MPKSEAIAQLVPPTTNAVNEAVLWLLVIAALCAAVGYAVIRHNDRSWRRRVNQDGAR